MKLATRWGMAAVMSDLSVRRSLIRIWWGLAAKIAHGVNEFSQKLFQCDVMPGIIVDARRWCGRAGDGQGQQGLLTFFAKGVNEKSVMTIDGAEVDSNLFLMVGKDFECRLLAEDTQVSVCFSFSSEIFRRVTGISIGLKCLLEAQLNRWPLLLLFRLCVSGRQVTFL
jgi:hypothetical protein